MDMGNLVGSRKSHSIKKDLEVIEHSPSRAFHYLQPVVITLNHYNDATGWLRTVASGPIPAYGPSDAQVATDAR
jgi:hypothetical protein